VIFTAESMNGSRIKAYAIDYQAMKVNIMYKDKFIKDQAARKFITYEIASQEILGTSTVTDQLIIGRFSSGLFSLANGHMYFGNEVFKIRYDIMERTASDII